MVMEFAGTFFRLIGKLLKMLFRPLRFTGLLYPAIALVLQEMLGSKLSLGTWLLAWLLCFYFCAQNMTRMFKRDPSFKLWKVLFNLARGATGNKETNPDIHADFVADKPEGHPVGKQKDKWIRFSDDYFYHSLTVGGSGSGKTQSQVLPLIKCTKLPSFIVDIKGELYEKAGKEGDKVFNPADPNAYGYDPFAFVSSDSMVLDINTIAAALIPDNPEAKDEFWTLEARSLLGGMLLFLFKKGLTFTEAMREIQSQNVADFVDVAVAEGDPDVCVLLGHFSGMADNTLSGVMATVSSKTMVFASDPDLMRCFNKTGDDCISPDDLMNGRNIYLCIPEARLEVYKHATQLMIGQFLKYFEKMPDGHEPKVNFILDEFFRLGKLSSVQMGAATLRSKGVRLHLICQSNSQIETLYGKLGAKTLYDNMQVKICLSASDPETQDYFSKLAGTWDREKKSFSSNQSGMAGFGRDSNGVSVSTEEKRVIKPEEIGRLSATNEALVFTPKGWGRVQKQFFYNCPDFQQQ